MAPDPKVSMAGRTVSDATLHRLLAGMSLFTMAMTVPQVWTVWVGRESAGVSLWSWGAYLAAALLWLWHGLRQGDRNIYLPCIGWVLLDAAVIAGVVAHMA